MNRFIQPAVILVLATLLAIGPGWCRLHCAAADDSEASRVGTCCHAKLADASHQQPSPASAECRCHAQPITNDVRGLVVEQPVHVLGIDPFASRPLGGHPVRMLNAAVWDGIPVVPIHVLKCVWRC